MDLFRENAKGKTLQQPEYQREESNESFEKQEKENLREMIQSLLFFESVED
jgi:hypothetical protein